MTLIIGVGSNRVSSARQNVEATPPDTPPQRVQSHKHNAHARENAKRKLNSKGLHGHAHIHNMHVEDSALALAQDRRPHYVVPKYTNAIAISIDNV